MAYPWNPYNYYPQAMATPAAVPAQNQSTGPIWIQGEAAAKSYLVAPGTTVALWDSESQTIYLKSADTSGMPSMRILDYTIAYYDEDPRTTAMGGSMRGYGNGSYRMSGKRDSMGRYSREGMSRTGYSRGGNNVVDGLKELMYAAPAEMQGEIQRLIKKLDNM